MGLCFFIEALLLGAKTAAAAAAEASRAYASGGGGGQGPEAGASSAAADPFCDATSFYRRFNLHEEGSGGGSGAGASPPSTSAPASASAYATDGGQPAPLAMASPCPFLAYIDLSFNYISEEGATALAEAVRMGLFPQLREVCVAQNPLDDLTGGLRLREACAPGCRVVY